MIDTDSPDLVPKLQAVQALGRFDGCCVMLCGCLGAGFSVRIFVVLEGSGDFLAVHKQTRHGSTFSGLYKKHHQHLPALKTIRKPNMGLNCENINFCHSLENAC